MAELNKQRVLIVDDDPIYLQVWEKILRGIMGCSYCLTNDPSTAEALLQHQSTQLVISDIVMGDATGYDIAKLVHRHQPDAEILLTTGYDCNAEHFDIGKSRFHILYKPYRNVADIQRLIQHLLDKDATSSDWDDESFSEHETTPSITEWHL